MAAGSIIIDLLMRTGSFSTDTKRAEKEMAALRKEAVAAGAAIGAAFSGVAIAAGYMVKSSIDAMDQMSKLAQQTGTTVEALSALTYAADLSGVSQEELGTAFVKLSKNMSEAASGSKEAAKGFDALGIAVVNADGSLRNADEVLADVAEKFAGYKDGAEKTALATELFGKAGAKLIPLLNSGRDGLEELRAEAERLGIVLDGDTAKSAEAFNDNITRMQAALRGVATLAARDLLPMLVKISEGFVEIAKNQTTVEVASGVVKGSLNALLNVLQAVAVLASDVGFVFLGLGRQIGAFAAQMEALGLSGATNAYTAAINMARAIASGGLGKFSAISDAVGEDAKRARAELDAFQARVLSLGKTGGRGDPRDFMGSGSGKGAAPRLPGSDTGSDKKTDFEKYLENLQKQLEKVQDLTIAEQILTDLRAGRVGDVSPEQEKILFDLGTRIQLTKDAAKALEDLAKQEDRERAAEERGTAAAEARLQALLDQGPAAALEKQRDEMLLLVQALESGRISAEQYQDAVTGILDLNPKIEEQKSLVEELGLTFTSSFEDAIVAGKKFSDVLQGLAQDILKIIVRRNITEPLASSFKSGGGDGIFSGIGDFFSNIFGGFFADGGNPPVGKASIVGENGPEWFVPNTPGTVIPNGAMAGGGGMVVNIMNNAPGVKVTPTERQENGVRQLDIMIDQIDQALGQRVARGTGALTGAMQNRWALGRARG